MLVLGSRGSGESIGANKGIGPAVEQFYDAFQQRVEAAGRTVKLWANGEAATQEETNARYPAAPVAGGWEGVADLIGAGLNVPKGMFGRYDRSVAKGQATLKVKIESTLAVCASTQLILAGYSQGAEVTGTVYRALTTAQRDRVLGVALFGDPDLTGKARTSLGTLDRNRNGILADASPGEFPAPLDKVRSYCHALDMVCQGALRWSAVNPLRKSFDKAQHTNYHVVGDKPGEDTYPVNAARFFANRVRPAPASAGPEATITPVEGAVPGEPFVVSAGESADPEGRPLTYAWDLDGSGAYATVTGGGILETSFPSPGERTIRLKVTNDAGQSATGTTSVHVGPPGAYAGVPGAPTAVAWAAAADHESGTLSWQPPAAGPSPAEGYEAVTADGRQVAILDHGGPSEITFHDWELPMTVVVRAINRRGASAGSAPVTMSLAQEGMIVGDSITQGSAGDFTWRYRLDKHESATGGQLALVGPRDDLFDNVANTLNDNHTYADPGFGQRHDALWGKSLAGAATHIRDEVAADTPDYLLVLLGSNDIAFGISDPAGTEASLRAFIANARAADPHERFVFGTLPPNQRMQSDAPYAAMVADYNARLSRTVDELSTWDSQISLADVGIDIVPSTDLWDGSHPDARGEVKIAAAFADSLAGNFSVGAPYPRPYPSVPLGPQTAPRLTAAPGDGQAVLSWNLSPGATGYYVYQKNVTAGETAFTRLPFPVSGPTWTAGLLFNGSTYQYQLRAVKGSAEGVFSSIATVTPAGPVPDSVTDLSARSGNGQAALSWTQVPNATGYCVYRKNVTAGETSFTQLPFPVPGPTWVAELLTPGATYQFQLQSVNGATRGGMSNAVAVTVGGSFPGPVTNLAASPGNGQAALSWTQVPNATGYYVYRKNVTAGETSFTQLPVPVLGPAWVAGLLTPGATYQFQLESVNGYLRGGLSNVATVTIPGQHRPE
ncbi:cutinase family protein [Actinocrispum sp. NPDC049592]|uniref:cutinase family protein n=1 Tax=Actinocrispum sp. NPDC049592 TaxID=3154835 RepID=UPI00343885E9